MRPISEKKVERLSRAIPYIAASVYAVILSYLSVVRYESFTDAWDFGGFAQSLADATRGGFFLQTIDAYFAKGFPQTEVISFMGLHFSPVLYLLVPIYALFPYPPTLLVVQTVALAVGGFPVYWLARRHLGLFSAVVFLVLYLTYPPLIGINLTDFHPEAFLVPSMLFAIYFGLDRRWKIALPFFVLALSVIEESGILVFGLLAFLFVYHRAWREKRFAAAIISVAIGSIVYSYVAAQLTYYFGLDPTGFTLTLNSENYSILGATAALGVPAALLRAPGSILAALEYQLQYKLGFLVDILAPVALLPIFYPESLLMAIPWLSIAFLSNYPGYYTIYGFHQAFVIFFVFPAAILALRRIKLRSPKLSARAFKVYLVFVLLVGLAFSATQAFPSSIYGSSFKVSPQNLAEDQILALLPGDASVLTTSDIFPHVAERLDAYTVPPSVLRTGYSVVDQEILDNINTTYILLNVGSGDGQIISENNAIFASKVFNGSYGLVGYSDKIMLLKAGYTGAPLLYNNPALYNSTNLDYDTRYTKALANDSLYFAPGTNWKNMWFGPYTFLPPGNYTAQFVLRISNPLPPTATVMRIDVDYGNLVTLTERVLNGADFANSGWQTFDLNFRLTKPTFEVQLRGVFPTNETGIYLESVNVVENR